MPRRRWLYPLLALLAAAAILAWDRRARTGAAEAPAPKAPRPAPTGGSGAATLRPAEAGPAAGGAPKPSER